jgi:hypothetical protein
LIHTTRCHSAGGLRNCHQLSTHCLALGKITCHMSHVLQTSCYLQAGQRLRLHCSSCKLHTLCHNYHDPNFISASSQSTAQLLAHMHLFSCTHPCHLCHLQAAGLQAEYHRATTESKGAAAGAEGGASRSDLQAKVDALSKDRTSLRQQVEDAEQARRKAEVNLEAMKSQAKVGGCAAELVLHCAVLRCTGTALAERTLCQTGHPSPAQSEAHPAPPLLLPRQSLNQEYDRLLAEKDHLVRQLGQAGGSKKAD